MRRRLLRVVAPGTAVLTLVLAIGHDAPVLAAKLTAAGRAKPAPKRLRDKITARAAGITATDPGVAADLQGLRLPLQDGLDARQTATGPGDPGVDGYVDTGRGELYVRPGMNARDRRQVVAHEAAHLWDAKHLNDRERDWIGRTLGAAPGRPWAEGASVNPSDGPGSERFAEAAGLIAAGVRSGKSTEPESLVGKLARTQSRTRGRYGVSMDAEQRQYVSNLVHLAPLLHARGQSGA